jgi:polyisoprenyl-phosphate glycosyltransferase
VGDIFHTLADTSGVTFPVTIPTAMDDSACEIGLRYSVVVPVHNSAPTLPDLCARVCRVLDSLGGAYEVILVNYGSTDWSTEAMSAVVHEADAPVHIIHLPQNMGQHHATMLGMARAYGEWVITIDDDLQYRPEDIMVLIGTASETGAEIVYGVPGQKRGPWVKSIGSQAALLLFNIFIGTNRAGSSFRLVKRGLVPDSNGSFDPHVFVDAIIARQRPRTVAVEVLHQPRMHDRSGHSPLWQMIWTVRMLMKYGSIM